MTEHEPLGEQVIERRDQLCDELQTLWARRAVDEGRIAGIRAELEYLERYRDATDLVEDADFIPKLPGI